ncbi:MAG: dTDP-4-dehydrorhamnose 3,5-epimerase [Bacteroidia bacterium]|nr:dTDP-4-dehydrorhamnose 3,5-epimerase [Bacteroidia bacterium]
MPFTKLEEPIPGLILIQARHFPDARGYFKESYNKKDFAAQVGIEAEFVQDNLSFSTRGVLRGLHFQAPPYAQGKLVSVLKGLARDVAVDIRKGSPHYGQTYWVDLSGDNHKMLYVPPGFAHGFVVLSEECIFHYKCTNFYHKDAEGGLMWNDPDLNIDWGLTEGIEISDKDKLNSSFAEFSSPFGEM